MSLYKKIKKTSLHETIVDEIERLVVAGQLKLGDSLPPERELAAQFGVSRTAVREATRVLCQRQLVTVQRGRGAVVAHPTLSVVYEPIRLLCKLGKATIVQLTEVRTGLEPEMAALAAVRATNEQFIAMEDIIGAHQATITDMDKAVPLDIAFHRAVCEASQNNLASVVLLSIHTMLRESMLGTYSLPGEPEVSLAKHMAIFRALRERDPEGARREMRDHLLRTAQNLQTLLAMGFLVERIEWKAVPDRYLIVDRDSAHSSAVDAAGLGQ